MENTQQKIYAAYQAAEKGNFDHARMILEETLYEHPNSMEAWLLLADLADTPDEARQCYQMVLEIDANNWVAQQRMKLLFVNVGVPAGTEIPSRPFTYPDEEDELDEYEDLSPTDIYQELEGVRFADEPGEDEEEKKPGVPTLKESYEAHKKLIWRIGGGVIAAFVLGVIAWVASVGYIAWRMGYLIFVGN